MLTVREDLRALFPESSIREFLAINGQLIKDMPGRQVLMFERDGRHFYIKQHFGVGWGEIFKNLLSMKLPVLGAMNEVRAIRQLTSLGIPTMTLAAWGAEGINPASQRSFLITEALENTEHLGDWLPRLMRHTDVRQRVVLKRKVLDTVADIARIMHSNGINHRDFYTCHLRLALPEDGSLPSASDIRLHVMDLHRVQQRNKTPLRWIAKDIGGLLFSVLCDTGGVRLSNTDLCRFMKRYKATSVREQLRDDNVFWSAVMKRTTDMLKKRPGCTPTMPRLLVRADSQGPRGLQQ